MRSILALGSRSGSRLAATAGLLVTAACGLAAVTSGTALADPPPTAWQPVVSNAAGALGRYDTVTQPVNVTGVLALLPTTGIPAAGTGVLSWNAGAQALSWRGGPAVAVNPAVSASYDLPESSGGPALIAVVSAGALPAAAASDTLTVASSPATAGFGNPDRDTGRGSAMFDGDIYLGLENRPRDGEVWRSADGVTWVQAAAPSFGQGSAIQHVDSLIVYNGELYAGTDSGQIWRTADGSLWTQATLTPGLGANITAFATFGGALYANQADSSHGGVFSSADGSNWTNVLTFPEYQDKYTEFLQAFDGRLYSDVGDYNGMLAGSGAGAIWSSPDGATWTQSGSDGFGDQDNTDISGLAVFDGDLYAGTFNKAEGAQVWRTADGTRWTDVASGGFGDPDNTIVHQLIVFDNELYAGTENDVEGGEIWRTSDGTDWSLASTPGFGTGEEMRIRSFFELGGYLYANGENDCAADDYPGCVQRGWELWRLEGGPTCAVTAVLRAGQGGTGSLDEEQVTVQAPDGLESISNVEISNGFVEWPDFSPGTTSPVVVTATKVAAGSPTIWSFDATDELGQTTYCG
jgi:hypothetical protein